jgi:hypothetical protein
MFDSKGLVEKAESGKAKSGKGLHDFQEFLNHRWTQGGSRRNHIVLVVVLGLVIENAKSRTRTRTRTKVFAKNV